METEHVYLVWGTEVSQLFQTFPRKGMETKAGNLKAPTSFFKLFPARGWKPRVQFYKPNVYFSFFFKLFPARGWKLVEEVDDFCPLTLFQTFPRKGMETL